MLCATLGTLSQDPLETNAPSPRLVLHLSTLWFLTRYGTSCRVESREGGCVTRGHTDTFPWHVVTQLVTIYKMCSKVDNQIWEGGISHQRVRGECLEGRTQHLNTSGFPAWRFLHTGPKNGHYSPTCPGLCPEGRILQLNSSSSPAWMFSTPGHKSKHTGRKNHPAQYQHAPEPGLDLTAYQRKISCVECFQNNLGVGGNHVFPYPGRGF